MIKHIYKISFWKNSDRIAEVRCDIRTEDTESLLAELRLMDFGIEMNKYTRTVIRYVERVNGKLKKHKIGHVNKTKHITIEDHGM